MPTALTDSSRELSLGQHARRLLWPAVRSYQHHRNALRCFGPPGLAAARIPTYSLPKELAALHALAMACPPGGRAMEIGSYLGASACYLAAGIQHRRGLLFCVDGWDNATMAEGERDTLAEFERNTAFLSDVIRPVVRKSEDLSLEDVGGELLDLVFIDGDHSHAAARRDRLTVEPWIADDGLLAFHDFRSEAFPGVTQAVDEILAEGVWRLEGVTERLCWLRR